MAKFSELNEKGKKIYNDNISIMNRQDCIDLAYSSQFNKKELEQKIEEKQKKFDEIENQLENAECCNGRAFATCIYSGFAIAKEEYETYWDDIIPDTVLNNNGWPKIEHIKEFCEKNGVKNNKELEEKNLECENVDGVEAQYIAIEESLKTGVSTIIDLEPGELWTEADFDRENEKLNKSIEYYENLERELSETEKEIEYYENLERELSETEKEIDKIQSEIDDLESEE